MSHTIAGILLPDALELADSGAVKDITVLDAIANAIGALQGAQSGSAAFVTNISGTYIGHKGLDGTTISSGSNPGTIINDAINYVFGLPNGGRVDLPYGNINLTTQNIVGKSGVCINGQGMMQQQRAGDGYGTTIIGPSGTDLTYLVDGMDAMGFTIQNLNINGNNKASNGIRMAGYRSLAQNVGVSNCVSRNFYLTAGALSTPADAYVNMQLINCYVDGFGISTAKGVVVGDTLGTLQATDGRIYSLDVFSCGNNGLEIHKGNWQGFGIHVTGNSGITPADAGVYLDATEFVGHGIVVDSIGHGHFFKISQPGVRLTDCTCIWPATATESSYNAVEIAAGAGVNIRGMYVQVRIATNKPNWVIHHVGSPAGTGRVIDGVTFIGTGLTGPASGMCNFPDDLDGYWCRGLYAHA